MKFLIVEPSWLPILIPLGPKYSPRGPGSLLVNQNSLLYKLKEKAQEMKLRNSGLKIMYPNLLVVTTGRQPAQTLIHLTTNCGQF